jgi:hypothetical protein
MDNDNLIKLFQSEQYVLEYWLTLSSLNNESELKTIKQMSKRYDWVTEQLNKLYEKIRN